MPNTTPNLQVTVAQAYGPIYDPNWIEPTGTETASDSDAPNPALADGVNLAELPAELVDNPATGTAGSVGTTGGSAFRTYDADNLGKLSSIGGDGNLGQAPEAESDFGRLGRFGGQTNNDIVATPLAVNRAEPFLPTNNPIQAPIIPPIGADPAPITPDTGNGSNNGGNTPPIIPAPAPISTGPSLEKLFSNGADVWNLQTVNANVVDRNFITHALGGDDHVNLPHTIEQANAIGYAPGNGFFGDAGNDTIIGQGLHDWIDGGVGLGDRLFGGAGNDRITDPDGVAVADGGLGNDTIEINFTAAWQDGRLGPSIMGGDGNDNVTLRGFYTAVKTDLGAGNDRFNGGDGRDIVNGGDGSDWIRGGGGSDVLTGGNGRDVFEWRLADLRDGAVDTFTDFTPGQDRININNLLSDIGALGKNIGNYFKLDALSPEKTGVYFDADGPKGKEDWQLLGVLQHSDQPGLQLTLSQVFGGKVSGAIDSPLNAISVALESSVRIKYADLLATNSIV